MLLWHFSESVSLRHGFFLGEWKKCKTANLMIESLASRVRELTTAAFAILLPLKATNHLVAVVVVSGLLTHMGYYIGAYFAFYRRETIPAGRKARTPTLRPCPPAATRTSSAGWTPCWATPWISPVCAPHPTAPKGSKTCCVVKSCVCFSPRAKRANGCIYISEAFRRWRANANHATLHVHKVSFSSRSSSKSVWNLPHFILKGWKLWLLKPHFDKTRNLHFQTPRKVLMLQLSGP